MYPTLSISPCVSIPMVFDGVCEDCGKVIFRGTKDSISFFDNSRCAKCEAEMFQYMQATDEEQKEVNF